VYKRKDAFYKKAKQAGYRSRAAYKLLELSHGFGLLRPGQRVIDLGAWPGGWLQVAAELVGPRGRVIGIDLVPIDPLSAGNVTVVQGDATDPDQQRRLLSLLDGPADILLSDMAPKLSGVRERDEAQAQELSRAAVVCTTRLLRPGGTLLLKAFIDSGHADRLAALRASFATVKTTKPQATRKGSAETYIIASGFVSC
jgi:23S rRNA (uridine2552-2'-O)-methyltransferase